MLLRLLKKENILIINKRNVTKLTNGVKPECHWVLSFMVRSFHEVNVSSIRCTKVIYVHHSEFPIQTKGLFRQTTRRRPYSDPRSFFLLASIKAKKLRRFATHSHCFTAQSKEKASGSTTVHRPFIQYHPKFNLFVFQDDMFGPVWRQGSVRVKYKVLLGSLFLSYCLFPHLLGSRDSPLRRSSIAHVMVHFTEHVLFG